jgi:hypothetical protein
MKHHELAAGRRFSAKFVARWRQLTAVAVVGVTLAACAGFGGVNKDSPDPEKQAAASARSMERWQAIIAGDVPKAYGYMSTGSKARLSIEDFRRKARLTGFKQATVESVVCEPELCKVTVRTTLDHRLMKDLALPVTETWVLEKGEYWYVWPL